MRALVCTERALEERRKRIANGEAQDNMPPVLPFVPDTPLGEGGVDDGECEQGASSSSTHGEERDDLAEMRKAWAAGKEGEGAGGAGGGGEEEEESVEPSDFVVSMSDSGDAADVGAGAGGGGVGMAGGGGARRNHRVRREGPQTAPSSRKRALSREGDWDGGGGEGGDSVGGCGGGEYRQQIDKELQRMGGVDNVPTLSSLIEQCEAQEGNTL